MVSWIHFPIVLQRMVAMRSRDTLRPWRSIALGWGLAAVIALVVGGATASADVASDGWSAGQIGMLPDDPPAKEKSSEAQDKPAPEEKSGAEGQDESAQSDDGKPADGDTQKKMDAERQRLIELIKKRAEAQRKQVEAGGRKTPPAVKPKQTPGTVVRPPGGAQHQHPVPGPKKPEPAKKPQAKSGKGCGGKDGGVDLTPPPEDQPQPKFVCKELEVSAEPVWQGGKAQFEFVIANEGEAPLAILLKGG
jgi:hypothetical protein